MNKRIRELMKQANPSGDFSECEWVFEKFAELIVRECADVCERFGESGDGYTCSYEILDHFGVEE